MNLYAEMKKRHQEEINNFPLMFAFSKERFAEEMQKLGLDPLEDEKPVMLFYQGQKMMAVSLRTQRASSENATWKQLYPAPG